MIERYVWKSGRFVSKTTGEPMAFKDPNAISMPMIQSDIAPYKSPLGEHWIDGRRAQREELKRNDMVIQERRSTFNKEAYAERKARQAQELAARRA